VGHKTFILLLGMFLGSLAPAAAQTSAPQIVASQEHAVPVTMILRPVSTPLLAASFLRPQDRGELSVHLSRLLARDHEGDLEHLPPTETVKTSILTQSSMQLIPFWSGRLQLEAFQSTLHLQNLQFDRYGDGTTGGSPLARQSYPGGLRSVHFSGLSLSFHFGRDTQTGHPARLWGRLTGFVGAVLN
jgi:hypothetical protein